MHKHILNYLPVWPHTTPVVRQQDSHQPYACTTPPALCAEVPVCQTLHGWGGGATITSTLSGGSASLMCHTSPEPHCKDCALTLPLHACTLACQKACKQSLNGVHVCRKVLSVVQACMTPFDREPDCFDTTSYMMISTPGCAEAYSALTGTPLSTLLNVSDTVNGMDAACALASAKVRSLPAGSCRSTVVQMHSTWPADTVNEGGQVPCI